MQMKKEKPKPVTLQVQSIKVISKITKVGGKDEQSIAK